MAENSDIKNTASFIRKKLQLEKPRTAVILGSGLSGCFCRRAGKCIGFGL